MSSSTLPIFKVDLLLQAAEVVDRNDTTGISTLDHAGWVVNLGDAYCLLTGCGCTWYHHPDLRTFTI